jgi:hypothetical protein
MTASTTALLTLSTGTASWGIENTVNHTWKTGWKSILPFASGWHTAYGIGQNATFITDIALGGAVGVYKAYSTYRADRIEKIGGGPAPTKIDLSSKEIKTDGGLVGAGWCGTVYKFKEHAYKFSAWEDSDQPQISARRGARILNEANGEYFGALAVQTSDGQFALRTPYIKGEQADDEDIKSFMDDYNLRTGRVVADDLSDGNFLTTGEDGRTYLIDPDFAIKPTRRQSFRSDEALDYIQNNPTEYIARRYQQLKDRYSRGEDE